MEKSWIFTASAEPPNNDARWYSNALDALDKATGPIVWYRSAEGVVRGGIDATSTLCAYAQGRALSVAHLWAKPMPDVVRQYLETGDETLKKPAEAAAEAAAWAFAESAAWASAWAARASAWAARASVWASAAAEASAWAAVSSAWAARASAESAAESAARASAESAAEKQLIEQLLPLIDAQAMPETLREMNKGVPE